MQKNEIEATAYHEATHAVMYVACLRGFDYVTIRPGGASLGHIKENKLDPDIAMSLDINMTFDYLIETIACIWAGPLGEARFLGTDVKGGDENDLEQIADVLTKLLEDPGEQEAFLSWMKVRTIKVIDQRWNQITDVAHALLSRKKLSQQEVLDIIQATQF